jgi:hypothetical protein
VWASCVGELVTVQIAPAGRAGDSRTGDAPYVGRCHRTRGRQASGEVPTRQLQARLTRDGHNNLVTRAAKGFAVRICQANTGEQAGP